MNSARERVRAYVTALERRIGGGPMNLDGVFDLAARQRRTLTLDDVKILMAQADALAYVDPQAAQAIEIGET